MSSSNLATRVDLAAPDLLLEPPRARLQLIAKTEPQPAPANRTRPSLAFRRIVLRDQGFRSFRIY